jgi:uncharacterized membrane protein
MTQTPPNPLPEATPDKSEPSKTSLWRQIRNNFIYGVIVTLPIVAPLWLVIFVVRKTDEVVKPIIPEIWNPDTYLPFSIPGLGLLTSIIALFVLGTLAKNFFGRTIIRTGERILGRVPVISNMYTAGKQIVSTVSQQKDRSFKEVCLLEYPRKGLWVVGFVSSDVRGAPAEHLPEGYVNVFVPTTPNPTSGVLVMLPRTDIKVLDMTTEEGAKLIISAGLVSSTEDEVDTSLLPEA